MDERSVAPAIAMPTGPARASKAVPAAVPPEAAPLAKPAPAPAAVSAPAVAAMFPPIVPKPVAPVAPNPPASAATLLPIVPKPSASPFAPRLDIVFAPMPFAIVGAEPAPKFDKVVAVVPAFASVGDIFNEDKSEIPNALSIAADIAGLFSYGLGACPLK